MSLKQPVQSAMGKRQSRLTCLKFERLCTGRCLKQCDLLTDCLNILDIGRSLQVS